MKNPIKFIEIPLIFFLLLFSFIACDNEFSEIDNDVLGQGNINFSSDTLELSVISYNKKLEGLQVNNLNANLLGVYNDPAFGQTIASIVAQLTPTTFNPNFGTNPVIDSVILKIPYYSRTANTDSGYTINDSLFGEEFNNNIPKPIKLSIYQNNYFLRDFDPFTNSTQRYYSKNALTHSASNGNSTIEFENHKGQLLKVIESFIPSADVIKQIKTVNGNTVIERTTPALRLKLDVDLNADDVEDFWQGLILNKEDKTVFSNSNNFRNYFRGLYFKAEAISNDGSMIMLNMNSNDAGITIYYKQGEEEQRTQSTYVLRFSGHKLNTYINDYDLITLQDGDDINGDEKLYLKGMEGSMSIIDLFENQAALDAFKNNFRESDGNGGFKFKKLINDAHLVIYEDETMLTSGIENLHKYDRIYAYDIKNSTPTVDYLIDPIQSLQNPFSSYITSLGQRLKDSNG